MIKTFYRGRLEFFYILFCLLPFIICIRLLLLQVISGYYKQTSHQSSIRRVTLYPSRGVLFDRNQKIIVANEPIYDLYITPLYLEINDTTLFTDVLGLTKEEINIKIKNARKFSAFRPSLFLKQIDHKTFSRFQERLWMNRGFDVEVKTVRMYRFPVGAQFLGYISEVNPEQIKQAEGYYRPGEYVGTSGIEKVYESRLRGRKGVRHILVDVHGQEYSSFGEGKYDTLAIGGENLITTIDIELQELAEELMQNKVGSIVALEPQTGEILCLVSAPMYDPGLLNGSRLGKNFSMLSRNPYHPLFVRPLMAQYPPGSTYKLISALAAMEEGFLDVSTSYKCAQGYSLGSLHVGCHRHASPLNLTGSIQYSCNAYYCHVFYNFVGNRKFRSPQEGFLKWREYMQAFGMGTRLGIDLPDEWPGILPTKNYYDKVYGTDRWKASTILSLGIGQGEMGMTPLQMANVMCIIANRGYYYQPHIVKGNLTAEGPQFFSGRQEKKQVPVKAVNFERIIEGMRLAVESGTAATCRIDGISLCGNTGTAQNPHGKDHSIFIAFAPYDKPEIALAVIVENAGWGAVAAAPVASLLIQKYLLGKIIRTDLYENILNLKTIHEGKENNRTD